MVRSSFSNPLKYCFEELPVEFSGDRSSLRVEGGYEAMITQFFRNIAWFLAEI